jgi:hypothetical protein
MNCQIDSTITSWRKKGKADKGSYDWLIEIIIQVQVEDLRQEEKFWLKVILSIFIVIVNSVSLTEQPGLAA